MLNKHMFSRRVVINPQTLSLLITYPAKIIDKNSLVTIDFLTPEDAEYLPSLTVQVNQSVVGQIVYLCLSQTQTDSDPLNHAQFYFFASQINQIVKETAAA